MMDFSRRSPLTELMDEPCSFEEFRDCLRDLAKVNAVTLAYAPTLAWLDKAVAAHPARPLRIVDVGCGYGDMLRRVGKWAAERDIAVTLTGVDLNPHSARAAQEVTAPERGIEWLTVNAFDYKPEGGIDIVICSLFTHHLSDAEIVQFVKWMEATARVGWFINDLHRHWFAYYGFRLLAGLMRWHRFVRHDGPVSILRSFIRHEWRELLAGAGVTDARICWRMPFRYCVGRVKAV